MAVPSVVSSSLITNPVQSIETYVCGTPQATAKQVTIGILFASFDTESGDTNVPTPSGWGKTAEIEIANHTYLAVYHRIGASPGSDVTFNLGKVALRADFAAFNLNGAGRGSPAPITVYDADFVLASTNHTLSGIETEEADSRLFFVHMDIGGGLDLAPPSGWSQLLDRIGSASQIALNIAHVTFLIPGATGPVTGTANIGNIAAMALFAVNPFLGPSEPSLIAPLGNENIAIGSVFQIRWNLPTDSGRVSQSALVTKIEISPNNGVSWADLEDETSAGATTFNWDTSSFAPGNLYLIRISVSDGTESSQTVQSATFRLFIETQPSKPTLVQPIGGVTRDRTLDFDFEWIHNAEGNPQTGYTLKHSPNPDMSSATELTGTTASKRTISGGTIAAGLRYWTMQTTGASLTSPVSDTGVFLLADPPSAPVIVSPTAVSPPNSSDPFIEWTATGQIKYRIRVIREGVEAYSSNFRTSSIQKIKLSQITGVVPYKFKNGIEVDVEVTIEDVNGLRASATETVVPAFSGPDAPELMVAGLDDLSCIQITGTNDGNAIFNRLYGFTNGESQAKPILIHGNLPPNFTYRDFNVGHSILNNYFAVAVGEADLESDESDVESASIILTRLWLHVVDTASVTTNVKGQLIVDLNNQKPHGLQVALQAVDARVIGRKDPITLFGPHSYDALRATVTIKNEERNKLEILRAIQEENGLVCARDQKSNIIFGRLLILSEIDIGPLVRLSIEVRRSAHIERMGRPT